MKKRIKDLRIHDTVFRQDRGSVMEYKIISISTETLVMMKGDYDKEEFKMTEQDLTRFKFEAGRWKYKFFLSRLDALKESRGHLDTELEGIFSNQQKFLESIQEANNHIRVVDAEIAKQLLIN